MTNVVWVGKCRTYFAYRASTCLQIRGHPSVMLLVGRTFPHSLRQRQHFSPFPRPLMWLLPGALEGSESEEYPWEPRDNHWRDIDTGRAWEPKRASEGLRVNQSQSPYSGILDSAASELLCQSKKSPPRSVCSILQMRRLRLTAPSHRAREWQMWNESSDFQTPGHHVASVSETTLLPHS